MAISRVLTGAGDPRSESPVPDGTFDRVFVDSQTGDVYTASGASASWVAAPLTAQINLSGSVGPTNGQTLYCGNGAGGSTSVANVPRWKAPRACTLQSLSLYLSVFGTKDTAANNIVLKVYNATTSTAYADSAVTLTAQNTMQSGAASGLSDAIAAGDELVIQMVCPTFTTAPTTVYVSATLYFR